MVIKFFKVDGKRVWINPRTVEVIDPGDEMCLHIADGDSKTTQTCHVDCGDDRKYHLRLSDESFVRICRAEQRKMQMPPHQPKQKEHAS